MIAEMQTLFAVIMAAFTGGIAGYIGSLMVSKRMALVGGAFGHLTLPGVALALVYGFDVSIGGLLFLAFGIVLIWLLEKRTRLSMEALAAVVMPSSLAVAFLYIPEDKTAQALIGDISQISATAVVATAALCVATYLLVRRIYGELVFSSISEDLAKAEGIDLGKDNFVFLASIAITVAIGVRVVGGLLTAALVAIPASTSRNLSRNLSQYAYGGMILGGLAGVFGILVSLFTEIPPGPSVIAISTLFFFASLFFKRR
jgi:zinc transport system permease protein